MMPLSKAVVHRIRQNTADSLCLGHLVVPSTYIRAHQIEDSLQRGNDVFANVVFGV